MKIIDNVTTTIPNGEDKFLDYTTLISLCINQQSEKWYTIDEMKKRIRILDILEKSDKKIELEDADFEKVKELVNTMPWAVIKKDIVTFVEYINNQK